MKRSLRLASAVLFATVSLWPVACTSPPADLHVGIVAYQEEKPTASTTLGTRRALQLFEEDLKRRGTLTLGDRPYRLVLHREIVPRRPEEAVSAVQRLIRQQQVSAIVATLFSSDAIPAGQAAEEAGIPILFPISSHPQVTAGRSFAFRMIYTDDLQGKALARFARGSLQAQTAAVLFDQTDEYSRGLAETFRAAFLADGGRSVAMLPHTPDDTSYDRLLAPLAVTPPEVLFLPAYDQTARLQGESARRVGLHSILLGADGWDQTLLAGNPAFAGAFTSAAWSSDFDRPEAREFTARYLERFKEKPNNSAALTYDALHLLVAAAEQAGQTDPRVLRRAILDLPPRQGVCGETDFTADGDPRKDVFILRFADGAATFHQTVRADRETR